LQHLQELSKFTMIYRPELVVESTLVPDLNCHNCGQELVVENYGPEDHGIVVEMLCPCCGAVLSVRGRVTFEIVEEDQ